MRSLAVAILFALTSSFAGPKSAPEANAAHAGSAPPTPQFRPDPIDLNTPYRASDYAFIGDAVGDSRVVSLGESIHVTREMPFVRLNLLRYLHENKGFDTIAFEGSLIDAWTAEEHAYRSREPLPKKAATLDLEALFGLWQTPEMQQVLAYALSTQNTPHPLYVTSFDLQPGYAHAYSGSASASLKAFLEALRSIRSSANPRCASGPASSAPLSAAMSSRRTTSRRGSWGSGSMQTRLWRRPIGRRFTLRCFGSFH